MNTLNPVSSRSPRIWRPADRVRRTGRIQGRMIEPLEERMFCSVSTTSTVGTDSTASNTDTTAATYAPDKRAPKKPLIIIIAILIG